MSDDLRFDDFVPELRSATMQAEITGNKFVGYALIYDEVADLGDFTEESQRGSIRKVLSSQTTSIPFVYDHKTDRIPMAFSHAGTLKLAEDTRGMHVEADLPQKNPDADTLREQMERGEVRHMSYGFIAGRGNSRIEQRGGKPHRVITGYNAILDVSPTWCPVYRGTSAELRSALLAGIPDLSQLTDGGAHTQPDGRATEQDPPAGAGEEERSDQDQASGVDIHEVEFAARKRRLEIRSHDA